MPPQPTDDADLTIPQDVLERHKAWQIAFLNATRSHHALGVLSVASSSIAVVAGSFNAPAGQIFAGLAAVLTAMLGFLKPERTYLKFVKAWRVLDLAAMKYRAGLIDRGELINAVAVGEAIITRMEEDVSTNATPTVERKQLQPQSEPQHRPQLQPRDQ